MKSDKDGAELLKHAKSGSFQAIAELLTWIERAPLDGVLSLGELFHPSQLAYRFGVTGPPGAGKSTLIGSLLGSLKEHGLKIGVIAVDPSSPFTQGAILGDRIRYAEHAVDQKVFIRSLGTRGSLGGLSGKAFLMARAFDVCGFDLVLIETVGVGQTELDILHVADDIGVVLVPESGDSIQAMKAGLMEIADIFIVNKSDRPGADILAREIEAVESGARVLQTTASEGRGVDELTQYVLGRRKHTSEWQSERAQPVRWQEEARAILRTEMEKKLSEQIRSIYDEVSFLKALSVSK